MNNLGHVTAYAATFAGVTSHLVYFRLGEHHLYGMRYLLIAVAVNLAAAFILSSESNLSLTASFSWSVWVSGFYFTGLYTSLLVFRVFFHPLRTFPGPLCCRVSSAWFASYLSQSDAFRQLEKLHDQHGKFLRIGSNDLSIAHPAAVQAIYGNGSTCRKAPWYDLTYPMVSLQSTRVKTDHDRRRRTWSLAFGDKNLRDYEQRMAPYRALLIRTIDQAGSLPIDISKMFNFYTFDVMGDLAFGSSFRMLETCSEHKAIRLLNKGLKPLAFMLPMWVFRMVIAFPGATREWWRFIMYCNDRLERRMQVKSDVPDIMSTLISPLKGCLPQAEELSWLRGDSQLIVVAGSDTTAATLTSIVMELVRNPLHISILRGELKGKQRNERGDFRHADIATLKHLNGIINEGLRLWPPVPSALQRVTPPEGLHIDGIYVPGNVTVYCPQYVIGRSPSCYKYPNKFMPARWYSCPDLAKDSSGFAPFSTGSYGCIGKPLALLNIRTTLCRIIADYDIRLPAETSLDVFDARRSEHFTMALPSLRLCFKRRDDVL